MKKQLFLTGALALASFGAHAQYYNQGQYYPVDYQQRYYQPATTQNYYQNSNNMSNSNFMLKPYLGIDYVYSMFNFKEDTGDWFADKYNNLNFSLGLKLYKNFGIEASAQLSDKKEKTGYGYYNGVTPATIKTEINYYAYSLDAVGYLPVSNIVDFIGTLGGGIYVFDEKAKITKSNGQVLEDISDSETRFAPRLGFGVEFRLNDNFAARVMARGAYLHYDDLDYIIDLQAGLRFYFK